MTTDVYKFDNSIYRGKPRHLHTLNDIPLIGTSTILGCLDKPGLTWWASGLAVESLGWTNKKQETREIREIKAAKYFHEIMEEISSFPDNIGAMWLEKLEQCYKAHSTKLDTSAIVGTDMHAELERYVKYCIATNDGSPRSLQFIEQVVDRTNDITDGFTIHKAVQIFAEWAFDNVQCFIASEAHCYSEKLWTGGIIDVCYLDNDSRLGLLDFKSSKEPYESHILQNAGYAIALAENGIFDADGNQKYGSIDYDFSDIYSLATFPFGMPEARPFFRYNVEEQKDTFRNVVHIYKFLQKMKKEAWGI